MFSFHRPKVYKSSKGCCICKAKSSSSRFTDSAKYEIDFIHCFQLTQPRRGEICNACVLLVKRFKRLPPGNQRHWGHIVDARVGPGLKSISKFKKRKAEQQKKQLQQQQQQQQQQNQQQQHQPLANGDGPSPSGLSSLQAGIKTNSIVSERFGKILKKTKAKKIILNTVASSDDNSMPSSPTSVQSDLDDASNQLIGLVTDVTATIKKNPRKSNSRLRKRKINPVNVFEGQWKEIPACCGIAYENELIKAISFVNSTNCQHHQSTPTSNLNIVVNKYNLINNICKIDGKSDAADLNDHLLKKVQIYAIWQTENAVNILDQHQHKTDEDKIGNINSDSSSGSSIITGNGGDIHTNDIAINCTNIEQIHQQTNPIHLNSIKNNERLSHTNESTHDEIKMSNSLHKIRPDSNKFKITSSKFKTCDFVKSLVKAKVNSNGTKAVPTNEKLIEPLKTKINENSSDSGYEDISDSNKSLINSFFLQSGIKFHVKPGNIVVTSRLAGMPPLNYDQILQTLPKTKDK